MLLRPLPRQTLLRTIFSYDPHTGVIVWARMLSNKVSPGTKLGPMVKINGINYETPRIIWKWMAGKDPSGLVDHADRNHLNNKWVNLREATFSQNLCNKVSPPRDLPRNIYLRHGKYVGKVCFEGTTYRLGPYEYLEEAVARRDQLLRETQGEFVCRS